MGNKDVISKWRAVIEGSPVENENNWSIVERMPLNKLQAKLNALNEEFAGRLVKHINCNECYRISHFSVLNENGKGEYAVNYHPFNESLERDYDKVKHTRPAREFFDGRFLI